MSYYTTINDPAAGAGATLAAGFNDLGQVVGYAYYGGASHGFLYSNGTYTTLDDPSATGGTYASAINDSGQIVGSYSDATGGHGFLYSNGTWITLDDPAAG